jgi:hypothetical protein
MAEEIIDESNMQRSSGTPQIQTKFPKDLKSEHNINLSYARTDSRQAIEEDSRFSEVSQLTYKDEEYLTNHLYHLEDEPDNDSECRILQKAFSETDNKSGPPFDPRIQLLLATRDSNGLYKSVMVGESIKTHCYHYQISGAVDLILNCTDTLTHISCYGKPILWTMPKQINFVKVLHI